VLKAKVAQEMSIDTGHDTKAVEIPSCGNRELLLPECVAANFFAHRHAQRDAGDQQNQPTAQLLYARPALDPFHGSAHGPDGGRKCRQQAQELDPGSVQSFRHESSAFFSKHFPAGWRTLRLLVPPIDPPGTWRYREGAQGLERGARTYFPRCRGLPTMKGLIRPVGIGLV